METTQYRSAKNAVTLILGKNERNVKTDRVALIKIGGAEPLPHVAGGAAAAEFLLEHEVDLVLCDERLADMSGLEFVALVRLHPRLQRLPLILFSGDNRREAVIAAKDAGCSGYLIRPYTSSALRLQLKRAFEREAAAAWNENESTARPEPSVQAFEVEFARFRKTVVVDLDPAKAWYEKGATDLQRRRPGQAAQAFVAALEHRPDFPEACLGLAHCWQRKGHAPVYREHLRKAAELFTAAGRIDEAQRVYAELKREDPAAKDPDRVIASGLIRAQKFADAARILAPILVQGSDKGAQPAGLYAQIARDCYFTDNPVQTAAALCRELGRTSGLKFEAQKLFQRIVGPNASSGSAQAAGSDRFVGLKAVLAVARYTFQAYFQGGAASV